MPCYDAILATSNYWILWFLAHDAPNCMFQGGPQEDRAPDSFVHHRFRISRRPFMIVGARIE
jgi:hypothetical protein